ncbi:MAG: toll/interleukin-1 receptor domain-containing protein [Pyrinomonadaceae bacterium]
MPPEQYNWDLFIAHAGPDKRTAEKLYDCLEQKSRVFLDSRTLNLGDDWDIELRRAQQKSLVTVVLISSKTQAAYYQREEIAAAIALARANAEKHRVVPVFLDKKAQSNDSVPYGLRLKHGVTVSDELSLQVVAERLLDLLSRLAKDARPGKRRAKKLKRKVPCPVPVQYDFPENLIDFDDQRDLFNGMLADSSQKRMMFIQAAGGRGKTSLLRMLSFHCDQGDIPHCRIDFRGQPYDNPHFTLALVICDRLGLSPRHLARALQPFSVYRPQGAMDDSNTISQTVAGVSVTHDALRQRHIQELLRNAFLADLGQLVKQKRGVVCLFDSFERLSAEEEDWLLDTLLKPIAIGELPGVRIVTAGHRWPKINKWEWEQNTHLVDGLPLMKEEHIKKYAEKLNIKIPDKEVGFYWRASAGIPLHMAMVVHNLRTVSEVA